MFRIVREIHFSYGHRLLNYEGKCARLHGHNARLQIELSSEKLNPLGMVIDFYEVSRVLGQWIDQTLDHRMILWDRDPYAELLSKAGEPVVIMSVNPTAENIAKWIFDEARKKRLPVAKVTLWETDRAAATYHE